MQNPSGRLRLHNDTLDADGDTGELVITTTSLHAHLGADGPRGHHHMMDGM